MPSYFFIRTKISFLSTHNLLERELIFIFVFLFLSVDICRMEGSGTGGERGRVLNCNRQEYISKKFCER